MRKVKKKRKTTYVRIAASNDGKYWQLLGEYPARKPFAFVISKFAVCKEIRISNIVK